MSEAELRIFSYLPNPRVWKSLIAADLCDVQVEVVGDKPANLAHWLWDYAARPLTEAQRNIDSPYARQSRRGFTGILFKTDEFLRTQPFGTVPCAFGQHGQVGLFESNSILRAVARAGQAQHNLYGEDIYAASRIDSFLDANLVFAREAQVYLLNIERISTEGYERMTAAYEFFLNGIESALQHTPYIAGDHLSIADISYVCDFAQFLREGHYVEQLQQQGFTLISAAGREQYPRAYQHMLELSDSEAFSKHMGSYLNWYKNSL